MSKEAGEELPEVVAEKEDDPAECSAGLWLLIGC
jgi:hypothetical protein